MIPIGICADYPNLPEAHALGYDYVETPLDALAELSDDYFEEFAAWCQGCGIRVQAVNRLLPEGLDILHESSQGRLRTLILRGREAELTARLESASPLFLESQPLTLEEIFIYELGGADYAVRDIVL